MKIEFIYPKFYDLIFHVMAYFKVNNASDLYNEDYIIQMADKKVNFAYNIIPEVSSLCGYYNENFERLMIINFLPYYCNSYEAMKFNLLSCNRFTQDDLHYFIKSFVEMLDKESLFFFKHWETLNHTYKVSRHSTEDYFRRKLKCTHVSLSTLINLAKFYFLIT